MVVEPLAGPSSPSRLRPPPPLSPFSHDGDVGSSSFISSTSSSILTSDAPTPYNTFSGPDVYATRSRESGEVMYDPRDTVGRPSFRPSLTAASSRSGHLSYSSYTSAQLLPTAPELPESPIPTSDKPVPPPPLLRRNQESPEGLPTPAKTALFATPPDTYIENPAVLSRSDSDPEAVISTGSAASSGPKSRKQVDTDAQRLRQLGYDAVLGRDYTFWSSLAISTSNVGALQGAVYAVSGTYDYGGPLMILIAWPLSGVASIFLTLTLSELASAYPVAGAMASWAWKCARGGVGHERAWGWLMGGFVLGGHMGNVLLVIWEECNIITGLMQMAYDYTPHLWQLTLFFLAILFVCGITGSMAWGRSHRFWLTAGAYLVCVWVILNACLIAGVARNSNRGISHHFYNTTGFSSKSYVGFLGWQYCTIASGFDASAHMAEETRHPSRNVPNAMTGSMVLTYIGGYISIILLLLAVKPEDAALISTRPFPVGHILERAVSRAGSIAISCLLILVLTLQALSQIQASSRFIFALARDNAMPFSESIRRTNSSKQPVVATWVVITLCAPLSLLTLAGSGPLYSVLAVTASSLSYTAYVVPALLYLLSKKDLQTEGRTSWSLRSLSKPCAVLGVLFGLAVIVSQMFPGSRPVTPATISWSPVILAGTALVCLFTWKLYGGKHYSGPIRALTKWETGVEIDLQSALASSRSRPEPRSDPLNAGTTRRRNSDTSIKINSDQYLSGLVHTVTVGSAHTVGTDQSRGEWEETTPEEWTGHVGEDTENSAVSEATETGRR